METGHIVTPARATGSHRWQRHQMYGMQAPTVNGHALESADPVPRYELVLSITWWLHCLVDVFGRRKGWSKARQKSSVEHMRQLGANTSARLRRGLCQLGTPGSAYILLRLVPWKGFFSANAYSIRNRLIGISLDIMDCLQQWEGSLQLHWTATTYLKLSSLQPVRG